jgi:MFS family permease
MNTNQFMRDHTGIVFADRAAFGNGPVMEFYVNFGWAGIIIGFFIFGYFIDRIDRKASTSLNSGQLLNFCKWFATGLAFIAPLTSVFFMVNTAIATYVIFSLIQYIVGRAPVRIRSSRAPMTRATKS